MDWGWQEKQHRIGQLMDQIMPLMTAGRAADAVPVQREALGLARELVVARPDDATFRQGLASILYGMGSTLTDAGHADEAVRLLDECQAIYEQLAVPEAYMADVCARRARAYSVAGRGVSAVLDADEAVVRYTRLDARDPDGAHALDLARVLTLAAVVQHRVGDQDLAVAAADEAIFAYTRGPAVPRTGPVDFHYLMMALEVVAEAHTIAGRAALATDADDSLISLLENRGTGQVAGALARLGLRQGDPVLTGRAREIDAAGAAEAVARVTAARLPTFADALTAAGIGALFQDLVANAQRSPTQSGRVNSDPRLALMNASALAPHAVRMLDGEAVDPGPGLRLALETHYLFVFASKGGEANLRYNFSAFGPDWARVVSGAASAFHRRGDTALAQDLTGWLAGITLRLEPFLDGDLRELYDACHAVIGTVGLPR
ncbi:hypothetical protein Lfu02_02390 [Longispora fulva]|uniref:Tetratricopeptide repeat protein n=2 Tax=Longispora fulva TaxID=619741 RepID=A0A8J7GD76_9ACTN|nr:hypothetical protein [Longispora fulva]MBG6135890.1 hypothetical protein [Longispora fulva]GIG55867.1 hypothetical protein Lfu02_02390 [Longispora fulva]